MIPRVLIITILIFSPRVLPKSIVDYYCQVVYPSISTFLGFLFNQINVSIGDILLIMTLVFIIVWLIRGKKSLRVVLNFFIILIFLFQFSWGLNYYRTPVEEKFQLNTNDLDIDEFELLYKQVLNRAIIEKANWDSISKNRLRFSTINLPKGIEEKFKSTIGSKSIPIRVKYSLLSEPISYLGTSGYLNPFTHEAHLNKNNPIFTQGFTACHEAAHQIGIARENEASYYGFLTSASCSDIHFRYSAYFTALRYLLGYGKAKFPESFERFYNKIPSEIIQDFKLLKEHQEKYQGPLHLISSSFYDLYLKLNNQKKGKKSYGRFTNLLFGLYRKEKSEKNKNGLLYGGY